MALVSCLLAVFNSLAGVALAHEQKTAVTEVLFNERSENLEIAHRFRVHDAEHALSKATGSSADLAGSKKAQSAFAKYVAERFHLTDVDGEPFPLTLLGQELDRGFLWVYQEAPIASLSEKSFFIENKILHEAVKGQINTVNVRYGSKVTTLVFEARSVRQRYARPGK